MDNEKKKIRIHRDIPACLVIIVIGLLFLGEARNYPADTARFPAFFAIVMLVLTSVVLVSAIIKSIKMTAQSEDAEEAINGNNAKSPLMCALAIGAYALAISYIGFYVSTIIFVIVFMYLQGYRDIKKAIIIAIIGDIAFYAIFQLVLGVYLPKGILL